MILAGLVTPSILLGQSKPVQMSFSDQNPLYNPLVDSRAALATGIAPIQESDFEPKSSEAQPQDKSNQDKSNQDIYNQGDPPPRTDIEDPDEALEEDSQEDTNEPIEKLNQDINNQDDQPPRPDIEDLDEALEEDSQEETNEPFEKLKSDDPVETPSFDLTEDTSDNSASSSDDQLESTKGKQTAFDDGYRLPTVASVSTPISPAPLASVTQHDPGGLLVAELYSDSRYVGPNSRYSGIQGVSATAKYKTWRAHNVYHRPTYFEDKNLELNGNRRPFQNVASAASFLGTIPRIPYLIGEHHPREKIYTFGQDRPGDAAPYRVFQPTGNRRGRVLQTISTLGLVLP